MSARSEQLHPIDRGRLGALACASLAVFALCAAIAADGRVGSVEEGVFRAINGLPDAIQPLLWAFQLVGVIVVPVLVAAVAWRCHRPRLAVAALAVVPLKLALEHLVAKQLVERERPGTSICQLDASCARFRSVPLDGLSFPSGHAVVAFALATLLWPHLPRRWAVTVVAVAVLNSFARVYLGAHNPLDVVGGAALGVLIGAVLLVVLTTGRGAAGDARVQRDRDSVGAPASPRHGQRPASIPQETWE